MLRLLAKTTALFALGFFVAAIIPNPPIQVSSSPENLLARSHEAYPTLSANSTSQLDTQNTKVVLSNQSIDARFAGLLSHVHWLIDQQNKTAVRSNSSSGSRSSSGVDMTLYSKQVEALSDDITDSASSLRKSLQTNGSFASAVLTTPVFSGPIGSNIALGPHFVSGDGDNEGIAIDASGNVQLTAGLRDTSGDMGGNGQILLSTGVGTNWVATSTLGISGALGNNMVTPDYIHSAGKVDESCLTYEATGDTWEWQSCGGGGSTFATTSMNTSAKLANIVTDETGSGALVFAGSPTLTGTLAAAAAKFSGAVGIGTTTPQTKLHLVDSVNSATYGGEGLLIQNTNPGTSAYTSLAFRNDAGNDATIWFASSNNSDLEPNILNIFNSVGAIELDTSGGGLRVATDGNVGIGTTTPTEKLTVAGNIKGDRFIGYGAGGLFDNSAVGENSLVSNTTGFRNTADGYSALYSNTIGSYNTAVGQWTLGSNTSGDGNTAVGNDALITNDTGHYNTALGQSALYYNTSGEYNTAGGNGALQNSVGDYNTAYGAYAGVHVTTGSVNTLLGNATGQGLTTGSYNTILGARVSGLAPNLSNNIILADGEGNQRINVNDIGNVGIGTTSPSQKLTVEGTFDTSGHTHIGNVGAVDYEPWDWGRVDTTLNVEEHYVGDPTVTSPYGSMGINSLLRYEPTVNVSTYAYGMSASVSGEGSHNIAGLVGLSSLAYNYTTGVADKIIGIEADANQSSGASANNMYGVATRVGIDTPGSTVVNAYGLNIQPTLNTVGANAISHLYGVYINDQSVANVTDVYNLYSAGATAKNYFAGKVGIGTTTPWQELSVSGDMALTGRIYDSLASAGVNGMVLLSTGSATKWVATSTLNVGGSAGFSTSAQLAALLSDETGTGAAVFNTNPTFAGTLTTNGSIDINDPYSGINFNGVRYFTASTSLLQIAIGQNAGVGDTNAFNSNFIGTAAGFQAVNAFNSNFMSYSAGYQATNAHDSNFLGNRAGYLATNASSSNFFGNSAGYRAVYADDSNFFGRNAGYQATSSANSNFFGNSAGYRAANASNAIFIGNHSGYTDAVDNSAGGTSIAIGDYSGTGGFSNSVAIGHGVVNSATSQLNIGNVLFATGIYGSDTQSATPNSGKIGIGTSTPAQKLQVFGNIRVGTIGSNGCLENFGGGVIGGTCSSDEGLKTNIVPLATSTSTDSYLLGITGLTPVTYNWNEEAAMLYSKDKTMANIGLTAQDVEAKFPELVSRNDEGYRQVNFTALQFYVIEALKELWVKVQGHDERLTKLEQENKDLKDRLSNIENKLDMQTPAKPAAVIGSTPTSTSLQTGTSTPPEILSLPQPPTSPPIEASSTFSLVPGVSQ